MSQPSSTSGEQLVFREVDVLDFGLSGKVNSIAISGQFLAVCDSIGLFVIYDLEKRTILARLSYPHEVVDLKWAAFPNEIMENASLVFSTLEGHIGSVQIGSTDITVSGCEAFRETVQHISCHPSRSAIAIGSWNTIQIWTPGPVEGYWRKLSPTDAFMVPDAHPQPQAALSSLVWLRSGSTLLVSHPSGVVWGLEYEDDWTYQIKWTITTTPCHYLIPSLKADRVIFHDPNYGIRCVSIPAGSIKWSFEHPALINCNYCPITWVDADNKSVFAVGGAAGKVRLWDGETGRYIQTLRSGSAGASSSTEIRALSTSSSNDQFTIYAGAHEPGEDKVSKICIWRTGT